MYQTFPRTQSLLKSQPWSAPEENFKFVPGQCYFGIIYCTLSTRDWELSSLWNTKDFDARIVVQNHLYIKHSLVQSLLEGSPWLSPEENFQIWGLQMPRKCSFGTILWNRIYIRCHLNNKYCTQRLLIKEPCNFKTNDSTIWNVHLLWHADATNYRRHQKYFLKDSICSPTRECTTVATQKRSVQWESLFSSPYSLSLMAFCFYIKFIPQLWKWKRWC